MMRGPPGEPGKDGRDGKDGIPGKQLAVYDNWLRHLSFLRQASREKWVLKMQFIKLLHLILHCRCIFFNHFCFMLQTGLRGEKGDFGAPGSLGPRGYVTN